MKLISLIVALLFTDCLFSQSFQKIHRDALLIDTHNDILSKAVDEGMVFDRDLSGKTHSDLARWKKGGLDAQIFSVFCDGEKENPFAYANQQIDTLDALIKRNPDKIVMVDNSKGMLKTIKQGKIAAMSGVEGGHMIENDLNKLDSFYKRGVRYMTLTWNNSTDWASSAADEKNKPNLEHKGLTDFGKQVVQRMNKLGMLVDISHVGEKTFWDVMATSTKPAFASHSSVYALCQHQRNLKDEQIKAIAKQGGVVQINFYSGFLDNDYFKNRKAFKAKHAAEADSLSKTGLTEEQRDNIIDDKYRTEVDQLRAPFSLLMQHLEYVIKLVGIDYVGIGSDFDGIDSPPSELDDVTTYPLITKALLEKGFSKKDINKIMGGNFLRVLKANEIN
ncbi:MAG: dipeptidase [Saprospiraceae bacterium]